MLIFRPYGIRKIPESYYLQNAGLTLSGTSPDGRLVETVELTDRPFHVGVQYHPEFKSRPNKPHPLFLGFVKASLGE